MIAANGDVIPLGNVEFLDPLRAATGAAWSVPAPTEPGRATASRVRHGADGRPHLR